MKKIILLFIFIITVINVSAQHSYVTKLTPLAGINSTTWTRDISLQIYDTNHSSTIGIFGEYGIGFYYKNHNRFRYLGIGTGIDGMIGRPKKSIEYNNDYTNSDINSQWIDRKYNTSTFSLYIPIYFTYQYIYNLKSVSFTYKVNSGVIYNYCKQNNKINTYWEIYENNNITYDPYKLNWDNINSGFNGYSELKIGLHIPIKQKIGCNIYIGYGFICKNNNNIFEFNEKYTLSMLFNF